MEAFRLLLVTLHYMGLYLQLSVSTVRQTGHGQIQNHISGNAMFTEVPHDMTAHRGQDVEMACSFRGAGTPSYSLVIQWWYIRNHLDWTDRQPWTTNEVAPDEEMPKDATKISVVKVVGSNISHKLRLSRVKQSDEGTYECRVIDFSDNAGVRHHRVRAYLQVVPEGDVIVGGDTNNENRHNNFDVVDDTKRDMVFVEEEGVESRGGAREHAHSHHQSHRHHQEQGKEPSSPSSHHSSGSHHQREDRELRKREVDSNQSHDCSNEPSCAL